jgi:hypothetical protein
MCLPHVRTFTLGVALGTDIGGAIPFPPKNIPGDINAYPRLNLSLGARVGYSFDSRRSLGTELNYKTVGMSADARVGNQRFQDGDAIQYFTGTSRMRMSFTMLEVPVYGRYTFCGGKDVALLGGYWAWIMDGEFVTDPQKGFIGSQPDLWEANIDNAMEDMNFTSSLGRWDAGLVCGYERLMFNRCHIGLRMMFGMKDVFRHGNRYFDYRMLHMRGAVTLCYDLLTLRRR